MINYGQFNAIQIQIIRKYHDFIPISQIIHTYMSWEIFMIITWDSNMIFTCFLTMKSVISHMRFDDLDFEIFSGQFLR